MTAATAATLNPVVDAANPAVAAAIAAYHMVDGIFDTSKPHDEGIAPGAKPYSQTLPIAPVAPVRLDLYV